MSRLGIAAAWLSAACCLPYLLIKVAWAVGVPVGITERGLLNDSDWTSANALMAVGELVGVLLVVVITRPWSLRLPAWLVLFPAWMGTGLLFPIVAVAALAGVVGSSGGDTGGDSGGFRPWVFVLVYAGFAGQGVALAVAFGCYIRARWGRLLGARTGDVLARRGFLPYVVLARVAVGLAVLAVVVAGVFGYWAAGGEHGLPAGFPWEHFAVQSAGALVAAAGMLGLAGRWGSRTRCWLPVTLAWVGSGSLAAFDGLNLVLIRLIGADSFAGGASPWVLFDTVQVVEVTTGVLAAVVAAAVVAGTSAAGPGVTHDAGAPSACPAPSGGDVGGNGS